MIHESLPTCPAQKNIFNHVPGQQHPSSMRQRWGARAPLVPATALQARSAMPVGAHWPLPLPVRMSWIPRCSHQALKGLQGQRQSCSAAQTSPGNTAALGTRRSWGPAAGWQGPRGLAGTPPASQLPRHGGSPTVVAKRVLDTSEAEVHRRQPLALHQLY